MITNIDLKLKKLTFIKNYKTQARNLIKLIYKVMIPLYFNQFKGF